MSQPRQLAQDRGLDKGPHSTVTPNRVRLLVAIEGLAKHLTAS